MNINRHNCEAYFLDYYEGRLSRVEIDVLYRFLAQNPELKSDFEDYGAIADSDVLLEPPETHPSVISGALKKQPAEDDLIALLEGQLSVEDRKALEELLETDKGLAVQFGLYKKTISQPNLQIQYPKKKELKKGAAIIPMLIRYGAVAALLSGAFLSVWIYQQQGSIENNTVLNDSDGRPQAKIEGIASQSIQSSKGDVITTYPNSIATIETDDASTSSTATNTSVISNVSHVKGAIADRSQTASESSPTRDSSPQKEFESIATLKPIGLSELPAPQVDHEIRGALVLSSGTNKTTAELPAHNEEIIDPSSESAIGTFLSDMGASMVDRFKTVAGDNVTVEKDDDQEAEVVTSTFRLGSFEIYRSRAKK